MVEQPQPGNRGSNPVAVNQFMIFFSIRFECSHSPSQLEMLLILRSLFNFDLISLFAPLFFIENEAEILQL